MAKPIQITWIFALVGSASFGTIVAEAAMYQGWLSPSAAVFAKYVVAILVYFLYKHIREIEDIHIRLDENHQLRALLDKESA